MPCTNSILCCMTPLSSSGKISLLPNSIFVIKTFGINPFCNTTAGSKIFNPFTPPNAKYPFFSLV